MTNTTKELLTREFIGLKIQIETKRVSIEREESFLKDVKSSYEEDRKRLQEIHHDLGLEGIAID